MRSLAVSIAGLNDAANISMQALEATNKNLRNAINNNMVPIEPVALWRDEVRQGVTDNVLYVLGFSLFWVQLLGSRSSPLLLVMAQAPC